MAFKFDFPETPAATLSEIWRALVRLVHQVEPKSVTIQNVEVGTTETPIAHGMRMVPAFCVPIAHNLQIVCQCKPPDAKHVYLRASAACVCDVKVWP